MTPPLDPVVRTRWLTALRSGDYRQGVGYLGYRDGAGDLAFCCLGVLCELAVDAGVVARHDVDGRFYYGDATDGPLDPDTTHVDVYDTDLPPVVREWAGLRPEDANPVLDDVADVGDVSMVDLNDGASAAPGIRAVEPRSFDEIADLIERYM